MNRYYTSPVLATELTNVGITVTGTLQTIRKGVPTAAKQGHKEPVGSVHAFRSDNSTGDILVLTWMDKSKIIMLSTKHKVGMVLVRTKPMIIIIIYYSHTLTIHTYIHTCTVIHMHVHTFSVSHTHMRAHTHTHTHLM